MANTMCRAPVESSLRCCAPMREALFGRGGGGGGGGQSKRPAGEGRGGGSALGR
eukprot:COSAG01_NODE_8944_length_2607_cov_5.086523_1_plen_53_part_10